MDATKALFAVMCGRNCAINCCASCSALGKFIWLVIFVSASVFAEISFQYLLRSYLVKHNFLLSPGNACVSQCGTGRCRGKLLVHQRNRQLEATFQAACKPPAGLRQLMFPAIWVGWHAHH